MLCGVLFRTLIREGRLTVIDAGGKRHVFGEDRSPAVTMRLHDRWIEKQLFLNPNLHIGEGYMDGRLTVEDGDLYDLLDLILRNVGWGYGHGLGEVLA
ncbi:MAG: SAM-dependent methyltransferase, partial [Proteobacteria bacterium]|nr:SAM-dependent methyltransferase [Pseudomonadota bacterium]